MAEKKPVERVFRYGDHTLPDPGAKFSIDRVRQALVGAFPELANATHSTKTMKDGRLQVTFEKQTTTNGLSS